MSDDQESTHDTEPKVDAKYTSAMPRREPPTPTAGARKVMNEAADEIQKLIDLHAKEAERFRQIEANLRAGKYLDVVVSIDESHEVHHYGLHIARQASQKLAEVQFVDRPTWDHGRYWTKYTAIERQAAAMDADNLREEIAKHERECDEPACVLGTILAEQLAIKEAC